MDIASARALATSWVQAHGTGAPAYHYLAVELASVIPDGAEAVAVVEIASEATIVAACTGTLLLIRCDGLENLPDNEQELSLRVERLPIAAGTSTAQMTERVRNTGGGTVRQREWTFALGGPDDDVTFDTTETLRGMFSGDAHPDEGEILARNIARQLGWPLPDPDPSVNEYR